MLSERQKAHGQVLELFLDAARRVSGYFLLGEWLEGPRHPPPPIQPSNVTHTPVQELHPQSRPVSSNTHPTTIRELLKK
jgi:hypothetical protein